MIKHIQNEKNQKSLKSKTFKILQYNIARIFSIYSSIECLVQSTILLVKIFHLIYAIAI